MIVVATVDVAATKPEVMVVVWNKMGSKMTTMLVGVELIVIGTVDVNWAVPDVMVVVCRGLGVG